MRLRDVLEEFKEKRLVDVKGGDVLIRSINLFLTNHTPLSIHSQFDEVREALNHLQHEQREMLLNLHVELQKGSVYEGVSFLLGASIFVITLFLSALLAIENPNVTAEEASQIIDTLVAILELMFK